MAKFTRLLGMAINGYLRSCLYLYAPLYTAIGASGEPEPHMCSLKDMQKHTHASMEEDCH